jgi:hypothetical protein
MMGSLSIALKNKVDCAGIQGSVQSGEVCQRVMGGSADLVAGGVKLGQGANANDTQLVGAVLWAVWCLTLSMGALGMAYLSRAAWKMGRLSEGLTSLRCCS